ncbi:xanthine dehydrogenase family protein molybdopterin-binding subunit [Candidatus Poriferisocius sp.]|uniref:xanthine dehydrogenase family protein molybdopterin-binding subunit n=1 Tax=Candidatus Poriferisocius sp. TaxID=3101276 RepID=UPI003B5B2F2F
MSATAARYVGQSVKRIEDPRLVTGHGRYVDDIVLPGMLHVAFGRSDLARATITRLDTTAAKALDGVYAVFTGPELNPHNDSLRASLHSPEAPAPPANMLADGDVRFVGDPYVMVVAESRYIAEDALELVDVEFEALDPIVDYEAAAEADVHVHPELGGNLAHDLAVPNPAQPEAFADAAHVVTETWYQHRQTNVPMETRGIVASWQPHAGVMEVWASSQSPHEMQLVGARVLGIGEHKMVVHFGDVGGGFGQKMFLGREDMAVLVAAKLLAAPLKWIEDRRENLLASNHARIEKMTVSMAVDENGAFLGADVAQLEDDGAYPLGGPATPGAMATMLFPGPYRVGPVSWAARTVYTNTCGRGAYRGPWQMESVAREQMIDHVARQIGMDPLELRRRNVLKPEDLPYQVSTGLHFESTISPDQTLEQAAEMIGYDDFRAEQAKAREQGRYLGLGMALYIEPTSMGMGPLGTESAMLRVEVDGHVNVFMGTGSHGQSLETTMAQLVADELGVRPEDVTLHQGHGSGYGFGTGGSRSAVIAGGAARAAASGVREKVVAIAAHLLEASADDLEVADGVIAVRGTPTASVSMAQVAATAYQNSDALPAGMEAGLEHTARYKAPPNTHSNACHMCTCEVDPGTGQVTLLRYVVSEDCGVLINPMVVDGQIAGGVVQGIGGVLYEHAVYDESGNPLASTFLDYLVPTAAEVPELECGHIVVPSDTPGGHKGTGEGGAIGAPPAVFNAVADALAPFGVHPNRQPLDPDTVLSLITASSD